MAASTAFYQSLNFFVDGIAYVNELNKSLTEIAIVTGKSQQEVALLGKEYNNLAHEMGVLAQDVSKASVEFLRQGLSMEDTMDRVSTATQYAKISSLDFKRAAEILTATVNSMGVDIERASDVFSYLGDATATGADEIGIAFQRVGGTAGALGIEFEKVASWIAVLSSRTREGSATIGNSIKSIMARIQNMRENGFAEEDGTQVNQVATALAEVDIALMDANGQFRDFGIVMDELGGKWQSIDSRTKAYLSTIIAGTYQQSRFLNLMEGYSDTIPLYEKSLESAGITQQKFNTYLDSNEAAINRLKTTWEGVWQSSFESDAIRTVVNTLDLLARSVKATIDNVGLFPTIIGLATASFLAFNNTTRASIMQQGMLSTSLVRAGDSMRIATGTSRAYQVSLYNMTLAARGATATITAMGTALKSTAAFIGRIALPIAGIMALSYGIGLVTEKIIKQREEQKKVQAEIETLTKSYKDNQSQINQLVSSYEELSRKRENGALSSDEEREYLDTQTQIHSLLPSLTDYVDENGQAHLRSADAIEKEISQLNELATIDSSKFVEGFSSSIDNLNEKIDQTAEKIERLKSASDPAGNPNYGGIIGGIPDLNESVSLEKQAQAIIAEREKNALVEEQIELFKELGDSYAASIGVQTNVTEADQKYIDTIVEKNRKLAETANGQSELENRVKGLVVGIDELRNKFGESITTQEEYSNVLDFIKQKFGENSDASNQLIQWISALSSEQYALADASDASADAQNQDVQAKLSNISATEVLWGITADMVSEAEAAIGVIQALSAMENLSAQQKGLLTQATAILANMFPHLNGKIAENIGWIQNEIGMMSALNGASGGVASVMQANQNSTTRVVAEQSNQRIAILNKELQQLNRFISAYESQITPGVNDNLNALMGKMYVRRNMINLEMASARSSSVQAYYGSGVAAGAVKPYNGSSSGSKGGSKSSGSKSSAAKEREIERYYTDEHAASLDALNRMLADSEYAMSRYDEANVKHRLELEKQIEINNRIQKLHADEQERLRLQTNELRKQKAAMGSFYKLSEEGKERYNELSKAIDDNVKKINDLRNSQISAMNANTQLEEELKSIYEDMADTVVDVYKQAYEKQRDLALKVIDDEMKAYRKAHDERLRLIDEEADKEDHEKTLAEKQKEIQELQTLINQLSMDETQKARVADLQAELAKKESDLQDYLTDRQREQRKQSLEDELSAKEEELNGKREKTEQHYEDLLNDERHWADVREQILAGNISNINNQLTEFSKLIKNNMSTIGQSISQNLIDKITEASNALKNFNNSGIGQFNPSASPSPSTGGSGSGSTGKTTHANNLPLRRKQGGFSTPKGGWDYTRSPVDYLMRKGYYAEFADRNGIYTALGGSGVYSGTPQQNSWLLEKLKNVPGLSTGGLTNFRNSKEGKLATLHDGEVILNPPQTKKFFDIVPKLADMSNSWINLTRNIKLPSLIQKPVSGQPIVNMEINIQRVEGGEQGANDLFSIMERKLSSKGVIFER